MRKCTEEDGKQNRLCFNNPSLTRKVSNKDVMDDWALKSSLLYP
jgi:hypothetical protein